MTGHVVLDVLARLDTRDFLDERLQTINPDLILVGLRPGEADEIGGPLLSLLPAARVIAFSSDARHAYVHEMRAHHVMLNDVSPPALIEAIRGVGSSSGM